LAGSRIFRSLVPTLLGLLFLAWLPAGGAAGPEDPLLFQVEEALSLTDLSDQGETGWGGWSDGEDGPDQTWRSFAADGLVSGTAGTQLCRKEPIAIFLAGLLGARHATGPPVLRS